MNDTQDNKWDKLLHIKTMGRDDSQSDQYRYPYEPTPYSVLQDVYKRQILDRMEAFSDNLTCIRN